MDALQQAFELHRVGRMAEAESAYRGILARNPNEPRALCLLGMVLHQTRRSPEALPLLQRSVTLHPNAAEPHFALGETLRALGRLSEAEPEYRRAVAIQPAYPAALNALGMTLVMMGRPTEAAEFWRRTLALKSDHPDANLNLGAFYAEQKKPAEALEFLRRGVTLRPNSALAHNNLGGALGDLGRTDEAVAHFRKSIELKPDYFEPMLNLAKKLIAVPGDMEEAQQVLDRALSIRPDDADARFLRGLVRLTLGDLKQGFADYEGRLLSQDIKLATTLTQPEWGPQSRVGTTVLLHAEQGTGDTIQFLRYAPLVAARGAKVIVLCQKPLVPLAQRVEGVMVAVAAGETQPPPFDLRASLVSLPRIFGTTLQTIPANVPYLRADPEKSRRWAQRLGPRRERLRVGLVWAGNPGHGNDENRSMHKGELAALAGAEGVTFFSLQKGHLGRPAPPPPPALPLTDHTALLEDFDETAALIEQLDVVITVDTSVAHLAGAMGRPVWVLLPKVPDWRWLLHRSDSPWYPTMRLFRQEVAGDWGAVVEKLKAALKEMPRTPSSPYSGERAGERG